MERAPIILTVLALSLFFVVPLMVWSIRQVRLGKYLLHKRTQTGTSVALFILLIFFEMQIPGTDWMKHTATSSFSEDTIRNYLSVHKSIAISMTLLWTLTLSLALWRTPSSPRPSPHSRLHKILGISSAVMMIITAISGWIFYWMAFIA